MWHLSFVPLEGAEVYKMILFKVGNELATVRVIRAAIAFQEILSEYLT